MVGSPNTLVGVLDFSAPFSLDIFYILNFELVHELVTTVLRMLSAAHSKKSEV